MEKEKKEVDEKYIKAICINIVKAIIVMAAPCPAAACA